MTSLTTCSITYYENFARRYKMAQIKFEDIKETSNTQNTSNVGFFSLKNDGDEAIVRIMHDNTDSFDIVSTHQIEVNGKFRRVNCCRSPYDPVDNCPLCAAGNASQQRFYIHLIQYVVNENNQVVPQLKVWERPISFANTIKNLIVTYGPLSGMIFKIKRSGAPKARDTSYNIMYMPPQQFPENIYPNIIDAFKGYTALGHMVLDKTPQELVAFITTGSFPAKNAENQQTQPRLTPYEPVTSGYVEAVQPNVTPMPYEMTTTAPVNAPYTVAPMPVQTPATTAIPNQQTTISRPTRFY